MSTKRTTQSPIMSLLGSERIRRVEHDGRTLYVAADVVAVLSGSRHPAEYWNDLKQREPGLADVCQAVSLPASPADDQAVEPAEAVDAVDFVGFLRVVQSVPSAKAERVKQWLARTALERVEEEKNPELAVLRTRRLYEQKGYSRQWVDKRLRGVSARHELTGEWYKRGATESDQFRTLTNEIIQGSFGMDVEGYRRFKNLFKTGENLRDHMTDVELALTALGETVAVALHRDRHSGAFDQLVADARDAGEVVAKTRAEIEQRTGHPVVQPGNHRGWWMPRRTSRPATPRAVAGGVDRMTAPEPQAPGRDAAEKASTAPELPAPQAPAADEKAVA